MKHLLAAIVVAFGLSGIAPSFAETAAPNPVETAEAKSTLTIANALITYGRSNKDALALISGVQMMITASKGTTVETGGQPIDLGAILDEAVAMAPDDQLIVARADALREEAETIVRDICYWEYWCDYYGYCEWWYVCY